jgi:hypothetical protein
MRRHQRWPLAAVAVFLAVAGALGAAMPACFKPDHPACAFTCIDPPHTCPAGFTCGADNLCHDPNNAGICDIDAPADAAAADSGGADAGPDR